jgi:hypothetical protein
MVAKNVEDHILSDTPFAPSTKKKGPTRLQHVLSVCFPILVVAGAIPLYHFFAPSFVLSIVYYVGVILTLLINLLLVCEIVGSLIWHKKCKKYNTERACELGTRHTAALISAYLPNEPVSGLRESMLASIRQERSPGSHHTVILGHNGGTEAQMAELRTAVRELRADLAPGDRPFVHIAELYHANSKSKAENVCIP